MSNGDVLVELGKVEKVLGGVVAVFGCAERGVTSG